MTDHKITWEPVSETSGMLYLADAIDVKLAPRIAQICQRIECEYPDVCEVTPSYTSLLVETRSLHTDLDRLGKKLLELAQLFVESADEGVPGKCIDLPVYYDPEVGPDLEKVARDVGLSVDEVIAIHSGHEYTVCAIGFAPGFAYLAEVDERIAVPRHPSPRSHVPAGSVAIAENQTAVYPLASPGGWHLIGNCPVPLYDPTQDPPSPFEIGDRVRLLPINREIFLKAGGRV